MSINVINTILSKIDDDSGNLIIQAYRYGKDDVIEVLEATPFGIGGKPPKNTPLLAVKTDRGTYVIGALTLKKEIEDGESILFSTDDKGNEIKSYVRCLNDGTVHILGDNDNAVLYSELEKKFNELKADFNKLVTTYNSHIHPADLSHAPVTVAPTVSQGQSSSVDISSAKSNNIKLAKN